MTKPFLILIIVLVLASALTLTLSGCAPANNQENDRDSNQYDNQGADRIKVIATIYPLYEFAREVGGDKVDVYLILPPGAEAHSFDPKPSDIQRIESSRLIVFVGPSFEPWMDDILAGANPEDLTLLEAGDIAGLVTPDESEPASGEEDHAGQKDPHFWLDFEKDRKVVAEIARQLSSIDPDNTDYYYRNSAKYQADLVELDREYQAGLASCSRRSFILNHDSFSYLAARYNLTQLPIFGLAPDQEPSSRKLREIIDLARDNNISVIFFESLVSPSVTQSIVEEIDGRILELNPGENFRSAQESDGQPFIAAMRSNLENLRIGLDCR